MLLLLEYAPNSKIVFAVKIFERLSVWATTKDCSTSLAAPVWWQSKGQAQEASEDGGKLLFPIAREVAACAKAPWMGRARMWDAFFFAHASPIAEP